MLKTRLMAGKSGKELHSYEGYDGDPVLVTTTHAQRHGTFTAATRTSAGTTTMIAAQGNDGIVLTDLILTTDKVNAATVTVTITDGANSVTLIAATVTDAPCNIAIPFGGRWETWQACYVNFVTEGTVDATLALGYFRIPWNKTLTYGEWSENL